MVAKFLQEFSHLEWFIDHVTNHVQPEGRRCQTFLPETNKMTGLLRRHTAGKEGT
jgi:hypothetical protein